MKPQDIVERAIYNIYFIIMRKIVDNEHASDTVRSTACDEAKTLVREQIVSTLTQNTCTPSHLYRVPTGTGSRGPSTGSDGQRTHHRRRPIRGEFYNALA